MRALLIALGFAHLLTGPVAFFAPHFFYDTVPGLSMMGPFNLHFIRDVGIAFAASGGAVVYGAVRHNRPVAIAGSVWPFLHALFHIQIEVARGLPMDVIMGFNVLAVIGPGLTVMALSWRLSEVHQR
ncbi:hypothetical protein ACR9YC_11705 [Parasphingorhabdus sp. DH2-15]|uniref:hypothetical protein n=1 Tax=Parasphingorhabdus sp. DH2-15 TaxID=3444112 RepID=UPI003F6887BF